MYFPHFTELEGTCRILRKKEIAPSDPRQGEKQNILILEIPNQHHLSNLETRSTIVNAAQLLFETRQKSQRFILDALLAKLLEYKIINGDVTRDELRHQLANVIKTDVAILMTLRNRRIKK